MLRAMLVLLLVVRAPAFMGEGGTFEFNVVVGERIFEVLGLPDGWRLKEVRHRGRVLPDHRLVLRARDLITDIEVFVSTAPQPLSRDFVSSVFTPQSPPPPGAAACAFAARHERRREQRPARGSPPPPGIGPRAVEPH
jgi:hypothetical protein